MTPSEDASTSAQRSEFALIAAIAARVPRADSGDDGQGNQHGNRQGNDVLVGIGDDTAVLVGDDHYDRLVTTDALIEGRHFERAELDAADLGWKALAVSISDVAAMGGEARHAVVALALPAALSGAFLDRLTDGLLACAAAYDVTLVGGDTTGTPGPLMITSTVLGRVPRGRALLRSQARPGDALLVTGALGGSRARRHLRPTPRQDVARSLVQDDAVHAMIDVSDGLSSDLGHVLDASGVGASVWADCIPIHPDATQAETLDGRSALDHALHDGEDFELLFTCESRRARALAATGVSGVPVTVIGRITAEPGQRLAPTQDQEDASVELERGGYDHFRRA